MAKVIGIITCNYTSKEKDFTSADRPIAAVPYVGRYRVIDFPMSNMVNAGIRTIGVIMPKNFRSLTDHLGAGKEWSLARKNGGLFILPGTAFGTARVGSRFLIRDLIQNRAMLERSSDGYVVFSSANIVFNADLNELVDAHIASGADITAYTKIANEDDADVVAFDAEDGVVKGMKYGVKEGELAFLDTFVVKRSLLLDMLDWYAANDHLDLIEAALTHGAPLTINTFMYDGYCAAIFNKMMDDARDGKIDIILTKSVSRFARNTVDVLEATRMLKDKGVDMFFENENLKLSDQQTEFVLTVISAVAQEESRNISENIKWGYQRKFERGEIQTKYKNFMGYTEKSANK